MSALLRELQRRNHLIEAAHAACDGPVSRMSGDRVRPLAERVSALRQMLAAVWREIPEIPGSEVDALIAAVPRVDSGHGRIVWFFAGAVFAGAVLGVFLAWAFLSL